MEVKFPKEKAKKILIILLSFLVVIILACIISKTGVVEIARNKIIEFRKASVETELQVIIDETKQQILENEERDATLADLKIAPSEQGYELNEVTGEVKYDDYYVTINEDLTIASIEEIVTNTYYEIMSTNENELEILLTIENEKGIERITASDITLDCKGKTKIALDRTLLEGEEYQIKLKLVGEEQEELHTLVASIYPNIKIINTNLDEIIEQTIQIDYSNNPNLINYYSIDGGQTWHTYEDIFNVELQKIDGEYEEKTLIAKSEYKEGKTIQKTTQAKEILKEPGDGIISEVAKNIKETGNYEITIEEEIYSIHAYVIEGDTILEEDQAYGEEADVGNNMVVVKVNGDLTINSGVTVTAYNTTLGGPKGMLIYATGTLTNNGTITMTERGANAEGQNVYLWRNVNSSYEYVPAVGASGGTLRNSNSYRNGITGQVGSPGTGRQTGGGASGGAAQGKSGAGAAGTSYSGGTGGGGAFYTNAGAGTSNGGAGGYGKASKPGSLWTVSSGGGAGNPGGTGTNSGNAGSNGTGGLLIIYSESFINNGTVSSNGSAGGTAYRCGGGGSGAGSINIFYRLDCIKGIITVDGGAAGRGTRNGESANGGVGGAGSVSIGSIATGSYVEYVEPDAETE